MYIIALFLFYSFSYEIEIKNAVYNIIYKNYIFNYENQTIQISESLKEQINSYFRIKQISKYKNYSFYSIEHINTNQNLIYSEKNLINFTSLIDSKNEFTQWNFIHTRNNNYKIQNKNKCYIYIRKFFVTCENITFEEASQFTIIKIYEELIENILDNEIIEKEPIDILIKYIDLRDPLLKRNGLHQLNKDFDNEELRYSIRSILKNIPWIRKIFILMPNEKVRFLKDYKIIKDKIVYINDKDILGHDSSNSLAFQFRYWKMKKFDISENFIVMDDDCFIGHPLNKTNFFYVVNGKVTPLIITFKFLEINNNIIKKKLEEYKTIINTNKDQTSASFKYSLYLTYLFILRKCNKSRFFPTHTHNAIPVNLKELKEIYDLVYQSEYKSGTLDSLYRHVENLQFQTLILSYTFIKYKKKVRNISNKLIQNKYSIFEDYNYSLFCINTGSLNYTLKSFMESKILMEYLFPYPTLYEIDNYTLPFLVFNTVYLIEKDFILYKIKKINLINSLEDKLKLYQKKLDNTRFFTCILFIFYLLYLKINIQEIKLNICF